MTFRTIGALLSVTLLSAGFANTKDSPDQQRDKIRNMAAATQAIDNLTCEAPV